MSDCCGNPYIGMNDEAYNPGEVRLYGRPCTDMAEDVLEDFSEALKRADQLKLNNDQINKISELVSAYVTKRFSEGSGQARDGKIILKVGGCQLIIDSGDKNVAICSIGVIYGYSYEGHCYKLPKPQIMYLPVTSGDIVDADCGCDCGYAASLGYRVWAIDKLRRVIALDVRSDDIKTLILDENLPGNRSPLAYSQAYQLSPQRLRD